MTNTMILRMVLSFVTAFVFSLRDAACYPNCANDWSNRRSEGREADAQKTRSAQWRNGNILCCLVSILCFATWTAG